MNNEWNFTFFQKHEMCSWSIETEAVFTKTEMNKEWNFTFLQKHEMCSWSIETEAVFTKREMNNEWNVNFLQITPPSIQHYYSIVNWITMTMVITFTI